MLISSSHHADDESSSNACSHAQRCCNKADFFIGVHCKVLYFLLSLASALSLRTWNASRNAKVNGCINNVTKKQDGNEDTQQSGAGLGSDGFAMHEAIIVSSLGNALHILARDELLSVREQELSSH